MVSVTVLVRRYTSDFAAPLRNLIGLRRLRRLRHEMNAAAESKAKGAGERESSVATQRTALEFSPNRPTECPNFCAPERDGPAEKLYTRR